MWWGFRDHGSLDPLVLRRRHPPKIRPTRSKIGMVIPRGERSRPHAPTCGHLRSPARSCGRINRMIHLFDKAKWLEAIVGVLSFPQRYILLSKAWGFQPGAKAFLTAMLPAKQPTKQLGERIQRWKSGANVKEDDEIILQYIEGLADKFESDGTLLQRGLEKSEFTHQMAESEDLEFIDFLGQTSIAPRLVGILPREQMKGMLTANQRFLIDRGSKEKVYFFYRLGFNGGGSFTAASDKLNFCGSGADSQKAMLVVRRIPARLRVPDIDDETDHLIYEEHYVDELDNDSSLYTSIAAAYVYEHFLTIISKDARTNGRGTIFTEASVAQVDLKQGMEDENFWFPGVVTMRSDCTPYKDRWNPTAYRFVLRAAPKDVVWDEEKGKRSAKSLSRTLKVLDLSGDQKIDASDFADFESDGIDTPDTWAELVRRLNIQSNLADLVVSGSRP